MIYVAVVHDGHTDADVKVFANEDQAIGWAQEQAEECDRHGTLKRFDADATYVWYVAWSSGHAYVMDKEIM